VISLAVWGILASSPAAEGPAPVLPTAPAPSIGYIGRPAFTLDRHLRRPVEPYAPQPGDIFLATDMAIWSRVGHSLIGGTGVQHSGIIFALPDGTLALIEAGPFNSTRIEVVDPCRHMAEHVAKGDWVWVRRRRVPLTPEQSARLTSFLMAQWGKRFATWRMLAQATPIKTRGKLRTHVLGKPHGPDRSSYYCSEMVVEGFVYAGLMDGATARPSATYPRDLFFGRSKNPYLDRHMDMDPGWLPPSQWIPRADDDVPLVRPHWR
jgi:hypothetical protein